MKKFLRLLKKDERGLTLVELLAVVVILAIVGAIAFVAIGNVMENSRQDAHIANAQQIISAAKLAEASGTEIPEAGTSTDDLDTIDILTDPWNKAEYTGTVYKNTNDVYSVDLAGEGCTLTNDTATEAALIADNARELCASTD